MSTQKNEHNPEIVNACPICRTIGPCKCYTLSKPAHITPPTDTTGSGREGETPETDAFSARLIPKNGRGEPLYMQALAEWRELSERLEAQRDAALAQVEALRRDVERAERRAAIWMSMIHGNPLEINELFHEAAKRFDAAIDSAQRQEGSKAD